MTIPPLPIILLLLILQSTEEREHDPWLKSAFDLIILIFHVMKFRAINYFLDINTLQLFVQTNSDTTRKAVIC